MNKVVRSIAPILALLVMLVVSLYLISDAMQDAARFEQIYLWLILFNSAGVIFLVVLIGKNIYRLVVQYRVRAVGSHFTARLVGIFVVLTLVPVVIVYYFSLTFLHRSIDSWFDVGIEQALENSLQLSQSSLDVRKKEALQTTLSMVESIKSTDEANIDVWLNEVRESSGAIELTLIGINDEIIGSSGDLTAASVLQHSGEAVLGQLKEGQHVISLEPLENTGMQIRVLVPISIAGLGTETIATLLALYPLTDQINDLAESVQDAYEQYKELAFLRDPLKYSFTLALSLILLLSVLSAIWVAFFAARRLVQPLSDLVEGTKAVAAGDYDQQVPLSGKDELGFLLRSFNEMTQKISQARQQAEHSQLLEESQRRYLETILERISSGVMTLDGEGVLQTVNVTACQILGVDLLQHLQKKLVDVGRDFPIIERFCDEVHDDIKSQAREWSKEIVVFSAGGRKVLTCRGAQLWNEDDVNAGQVIVFDDVSSLLKAQRDSAWNEMARRLAHEIKNPLTPIQLSAERIRRKLLADMPKEKAEFLDRATHTIVQQVEAMKAMVNAFTDYARAPEMQVEPVDLNHLIQDVSDLYLSHNPQVSLHLMLDQQDINLRADKGRLRQLLHNLIKNAFEVLEGNVGRINIITRCIEEYGRQYVELQVNDDGPGIADDMLEHLFEPYVTNKAKGTGLGLAIVKKITEEHGGMVWGENQSAGGASMIVRMPLLELPEDTENTNIYLGKTNTA
ncbi:MAG: HAMP domain-containing protein [Gammaproteobacteria bacterium]|nr:HAMP domain-containing protein [Gammaproteobacteria bacterium]